MVLERTKEDHRRLINNPADPDYEMLMDKIICAAETRVYRDYPNFEQSTAKAVVVNISPNVEGAFEKACFGRTVHVVPYNPNRPKFKSREFEVARLGIQVFDFDNDTSAMPAFEQKFGGKPQSIAMVRYFFRRSGGTDLWVKVKGDWVMLTEISRLQT
jgi:hypothetical protein